jgi:2,4-dienoyl-CoA reductase-like NADH-dependent reductase (Old Yellow Enzyme family)
MGDLLNEPLNLPCGAVLRNRIAKAAMTEGLADAFNRPTHAHPNLYRRWSKSGAGLLITGNVMVDRRYLEHPGNVAIEDDSSLKELTVWANSGVIAGNHLWMQLSHAGRQTPKAIASRPVGPSAVGSHALGKSTGRPKALKIDEITDIIERFALAAAVAREAGFTGVQIHAAHGYLISEFLSPLANRRKDEYGGPIEHRARLLIEIVRAVREAVGDDFPIGVKLNSADFQKGGFSLDDCIAVSKYLNAENIDLLEISGGNYEAPAMLMGNDGAKSVGAHQMSLPREAFFLEYAKLIREQIKTPLMVTGGFRSRAVMLDALEQNQLDMIGLARPFCVQTDFPKGLLQSSLDQVPSMENRVRLGPGPLSGKSMFKIIRQLNHVAVMSWCWMQMHRLGKNLEPDWEIGALEAMRDYIRMEEDMTDELIRDVPRKTAAVAIKRPATVAQAEPDIDWLDH